MLFASIILGFIVGGFISFFFPIVFEFLGFISPAQYDAQPWETDSFGFFFWSLPFTIIMFTYIFHQLFSGRKINIFIVFVNIFAIIAITYKILH